MVAPSAPSPGRHSFLPHSAGVLSSSLLVLLLASCAGWRQVETAPEPLKTVSVQQAANGRFVACSEGDCERPTPKTLMPVMATRPPLPAPVMLATPIAPTSTPATPPGRAALRVERVTVMFGSDSGALDARAQQALRRIQPLLRQAKTIRAVGFTDDRGPRAANDHVAESRAIAVMQFLRGLLGDDLRQGPVLSANGQGKCCYLNANANDAERAANRRVELVLSFEDTAATERLVEQYAGSMKHVAASMPASVPVAKAGTLRDAAAGRGQTPLLTPYASGAKVPHAH